MKSFASVGVILLSAALTAGAREWKDTGGRTIEAELVQVYADRTVALKTAAGKTITVPFATFGPSDVAFLETQLAQPVRGKLHRVPWEELNRLFGLSVWQDSSLWDDPTGPAAERMRLRPESKTAFMENHRAYPLGKNSMLGEPVYAVALYGDAQNVTGASFIFLNQGDMPMPKEYISPKVIKEMAGQIEAAGMRIHDALAAALGPPKRDALGKGELRERVWRWDWNGHAIMLTMQEGRYAALRIMPSDRADRAGRTDKITESALKKRMHDCVVRRDSGDVVISNIPMIDQGPKGYCAPATWERYLRYMDIPVDMYLLALAADTGIGGGTYANEMFEATRLLISANGRELESVKSSLKIEEIAAYIDQGLPIMWHLLSTPDFQNAANENTARRSGAKDKKKKQAGQAEDTTPGGHVCLIIGYNAQTGEIAISDSWGAQFAERWVDVRAARKVSMGGLYVLRW